MQLYTMAFRAMGSQVHIWLETTEDGGAILQPVPGWFETIEASLSRFRSESELSRLNTRVGEWVDASAILYTAMAEAQRAAHMTDGLVTPLVLPALLAAGYDRSFDSLSDDPPQPDSPHPTRIESDSMALKQWDTIQLDDDESSVWVPGPVDLGGTAKGWTAQQLADQLAEYGPCLVDVGGDIVGRGKPWPIQVYDPMRPDQPFTTFTLTDRVVATSGTDYRRWNARNHHIIDPRTGTPAETDVVSATVIHPDAVLAEAYAKTVLIQGSLDGLHWLASQPDTAGLAFDHTGQVMATENFQSYITQGE